MQKINTDLLRLNDIINAVIDIGIISLSDKSSRTDLLATAYAIAIIG